MKVYVQKIEGEFVDESAFSVFWGFKSMGISVIPFEEKPPRERNAKDIVYGKIGVVYDALRELNIKIPDNPVIPEELKQYFGRRTWESTLGKFKEDNKMYPIFVKPMHENKLFNGFVVRSQEDLFKLNEFDNKTVLFVSDVVDFVSEYRCFVLKGEMIGCKHYKGNFTSVPDFKLMQDAIRNIIDPMVAYSIDFGVTSNNETLLIEINDTYSLRNYGLASRLFCEMIRQRWNQIIKNKSSTD
jgi:hypothetical protein